MDHLFVSLCRTVRFGGQPRTPSGLRGSTVALDCFSSPEKAATCPAAKEEQYAEQLRDARVGLHTTLIRKAEDNTAAVPREEQASPRRDRLELRSKVNSAGGLCNMTIRTSSLAFA